MHGDRGGQNEFRASWLLSPPPCMLSQALVACATQNDQWAAIAWQNPIAAGDPAKLRPPRPSRSLVFSQPGLVFLKCRCGPSIAGWPAGEGVKMARGCATTHIPRARLLCMP